MIFTRASGLTVHNLFLLQAYKLPHSSAPSSVSTVSLGLLCQDILGGMDTVPAALHMVPALLVYMDVPLPHPLRDTPLALQCDGRRDAEPVLAGIPSWLGLYTEAAGPR